MAKKNTENTTAATTETKAVGAETQAKRDAAKAALSAISKAVRGPRGVKKAENEAAKAARVAEKIAKYLAELHTGQLGRKGKFGPQLALTRVVVLIKLGATPEQVGACQALGQVAPWEKLGEPVEQFATAKGADPKVVFDGLMRARKAELIRATTGEASKGPQTAANEPKTKRTPKASKARKAA